MKKKKRTFSPCRREFVRDVLSGAIAGTLFMVIPAGAEVYKKIPGQIPGTQDREYDYDMEKAHFAFVVDITRCIGCGACCVADQREYNVPPGHYRTWVERYIKDLNDDIYVDSPEGGLGGYTEPRKNLPHPVRDTFFVPKLCNMCKEPPCVQVCPVGATFKTPDGFILVDPTHCVGCAYCVQACPYSARFLNPVTHNAEKCTWCYHRVRKGMLPACVNACPRQARKFGDLNDRKSEVSKIVRGPGVITVLKKDMGTHPALYYQGARREVI